MAKNRYWDSKKLAKKIRDKIVANTKEGKDKDGNKFTEYSDKPFAMPYGAVTNKKKLKNNKSVVSYFINPNTKGLWVTWLNGYKQYKEIMYGHNKVNLLNTGGMLRSFTTLNITQKGDSGGTSTLKTNFGDFQIPIPEEVRITLGWTDKEKAKIAYYNKLKGRDMFGLAKTDLDKIVDRMLPKKK